MSVYKAAQELATEGKCLDMQSFIASDTQGYADKYDVALVLTNVFDLAQQAALRIKWSMPLGADMPW